MNKQKDIESKKWCLTLHDWNDCDFATLKNYFSSKKFFIIGKELGEHGTTKHLQIAICHKSAIRFSTLKKLNNKLHIEKMKGTLWQAFNYCRKEGDFITNVPDEQWQEWEIEDNKKEKKKDKKIKDTGDEEFLYHYNNHRFIISDVTYDMYIKVFDLDNIEDPLKTQVFRDIRLYHESKHCIWCEFANKVTSDP